MPQTEIELNPVDHITTDALGPPGKRIFYIQGWKGERIISLILEKTQIQALAIGVEEFLGDIATRFPDLNKVTGDYEEDKMHIHPPVDPLFRVGEIHLGYHVDSDLAVLIVREVLTDDKPAEDATVVRFWCTRAQLRAMSLWGLEVAARGRAVCPFCSEPINPEEKHICVKKNGKKH